jgi:hypothetical protein
MNLNLVIGILRKLACEIDRVHTICGGGVAGALVWPKRVACSPEYGASLPNNIDLIGSTLSPATAAQGMAQADGGIFLAGFCLDSLAQSIIADAAGVAAIAIVSQSGPSRTSNISAIRKKAEYRKIRNAGRALLLMTRL